MSDFPVKVAPQHLEEALAQLAQQFHDKPNIAALLAAFIEQIQDLEDVLVSLHDLRNIDVASDTQLDGIGLIVGEGRGGRDDPSYRSAIRARISLNNSSGTIEELIALARAIVGLVDVQFTDYYPAGFELTVIDPVTPDPPAWAPLTAYVVGDKRSNFGRAYEVTVAGTSAASGGPSGTGSGIVDGTVTWTFTGDGAGARMASLVISGKPAGVKGIVRWEESNHPFGFDGDSESFGFDDGQFAQAHDF